MSKIDNVINNLKESKDDLMAPDGCVTVFEHDLEALLEWAARVRENNPFLIGDRVKLATTGDPDDAPEPKEGVVVGFAGPNAVLVSSGEYHSLYYPFESVERVEE